MVSSCTKIEKTLKEFDIAVYIGQLGIPKTHIEKGILKYLPSGEIHNFKEGIANAIILVDKDIGDMYELKLTDEGIQGGWNKVVKDKNLKIGDHLQLEYDKNVHLLYMKIYRKDVSEKLSTDTIRLLRGRIQKVLTSQEFDHLSLPRAYIIFHIEPDLHVDDKKKLNKGESVRIFLSIGRDVYTLKLSTMLGLHDGWDDIVVEKKLKVGDHLQLDYACTGPALDMKIYVNLDC